MFVCLLSKMLHMNVRLLYCASSHCLAQCLPLFCAFTPYYIQHEKPHRMFHPRSSQLAEFTADFTPGDIARLALGLSYLKAEISSNCSSALMKAVYMKVRSNALLVHAIK